VITLQHSAAAAQEQPKQLQQPQHCQIQDQQFQQPQLSQYSHQHQQEQAAPTIGDLLQVQGDRI
jgi:hypothetical protein